MMSADFGPKSAKIGQNQGNFLVKSKTPQLRQKLSNFDDLPIK